MSQKAGDLADHLNEEVFGRDKEKKLLSRLLKSKEAEFIAVYGRRRVGKTYLIDRYLAPQCDLVFSVKGIKDASMSQQLNSFKKELERVFFNGIPLPDLKSWMEAFDVLANAIHAQVQQKKLPNILIFLDELPWMATPKSGLIQSLDHLWNKHLSKWSMIRLVVCGSAASWMIDHLIQDQGGLHNRVTQILKIEPFLLSETKQYLTSRNVRLSNHQILEIYMAIGGVPLYLRQVQPGLSATQNIASICFDPNGYLKDEFNRIFSSLFHSPESYVQIIKALADTPNGLEVTELSKKTKHKLGGGFAKKLRELEEAGFISSMAPFQKKVKNTIYRVTDEYCLFYLKWIVHAPKGIFSQSSSGYWEAKQRSPSFQSWKGYAFESICLKHLTQIKIALGLQNIMTEGGPWRYIPKKKSKNEQGAQIDLALDRSDGSISIFEIKFSDNEFEISKAYARELENKMEVFRVQTQTKKTLFLEFITTYGLKQGLWNEGLVAHSIQLDALF